MSNKLQYPIVGCQLTMSMVQHSIQVKGNLPLGSKQFNYSFLVTAFSLSPDGMDMVIGTQSGHLFKCSSELKKNPKNINGTCIMNSFSRLDSFQSKYFYVSTIKPIHQEHLLCRTFVFFSE